MEDGFRGLPFFGAVALVFVEPAFALGTGFFVDPDLALVFAAFVGVFPALRADCVLVFFNAFFKLALVLVEETLALALALALLAILLFAGFAFAVLAFVAPAFVPLDFVVLAFVVLVFVVLGFAVGASLVVDFVALGFVALAFVVLDVLAAFLVPALVPFFLPADAAMSASLYVLKGRWTDQGLPPETGRARKLTEPSKVGHIVG